MQSVEVHDLLLSISSHFWAEVVSAWHTTLHKTTLCSLQVITLLLLQSKRVCKCINQNIQHVFLIKSVVTSYDK